MISASLGSHRFEAGPTYHFNDSRFEELSHVIRSPKPTLEYVNTIPGINADTEEIRQVAASGIARLAVQGSDMGLLELAGNTLVNVCDGGDIDVSEFTDRVNGRDTFPFTHLSNQTLDSASVLATRINKAQETAAIIEVEAPTDEGYFIIGLANGGVISAARTYTWLPEGSHSFGMVRFSRHKSGDKEPNMYPYPDSRKEYLKQLAGDRQVVVYDEDYHSGKTLKTATDYFADLFETTVLGISPVEVERRITFKPLVIKSE